MMIIRSFLKRISYIVNLFFFVDIPFRSIKFPETTPKKDVYIVGAPRVGSTFAYQILVSTRAFSYISNLEYFFYKYLFLSAFLSKLFCRNDAKTSFKSSIGFESSLCAPSEANLFWKYSLNMSLQGELKRISAKKRRTYLRWLNFKKILSGTNSFVSSWNAHSLYIETLVSLGNDLLFVHIKRDPVDVAISILKARVQSSGDINNPWSVDPRPDLFVGNPVVDVVRQIWQIEKVIYHNKLRYPDLFLTIEYCDICSNPREFAISVLDRLDLPTSEYENIPIKSKFSSNANFHNLRPKVSLEVERLDWASFKDN